MHVMSFSRLDQNTFSMADNVVFKRVTKAKFTSGKILSRRYYEISPDNLTF